jgi:hypothetical protein
MKSSSLHTLLILFIIFFSFWGTAQVLSDFDGKYVGKFNPGGFEDSVIINNGMLAHIHNVGWGYGVEHQMVYSMKSLKGEMVTFEQIGYLRDRVEEEHNPKEGALHERTVVLAKDGEGNLQIIYPGSAEVIIFQKVED